MIKSFTHDCGCTFVRKDIEHVFEQSVYCPAHPQDRTIIDRQPFGSVRGTEVYPSPFTQVCETVKCGLCGQVYPADEECGHGARVYEHHYTFSTRERRALRLAVLQQAVALSAERLRADSHTLPTFTEEISTLDSITKKLHG